MELKNITPKKSARKPKKKKPSGEELSLYIKRTFEKRGKKALEIARQTISEEETKLKSKEAREALHYFMNSYWNETTRPALLSIACEALGGDPDMTTPIATPLILISGAVDIHDDIIDQTKSKRNHMTVYGKFGKDIALLVGDALLLKGFTLFHEAHKKIQLERADALFQLIKESFYELGDAESLELSLKKRIMNVKVEEYLEFVHKKAADFEAYMRISALLANASTKETEALGRYGRILGILVILGDDNFDMLDPSEMVNRIRNEVWPLPLIYALQKSYLKKKLIPLLQKGKLTTKDAENIFDLVYVSGIFDDIESYFKKFVAEAKRNLRFIKNNILLTQILESTYPK